MSLQEILAEASAQGAKRMPAEAIATMQAATAELNEAGIGQTAPKVGDTLPDGTFTDQNGNTVTLASLLEKGPVVLNFYRGGWCPYCNLELKAYQDLLADITAKGASLVAITPEKPDNSLTTIEKNDLAFPVLTDDGNAFAKALDLVFDFPPQLKDLYANFGLNLPEVNAGTGWSLAIPAVFVLDAEGKVLFADVDLDYRRRAEPSEAIAVLN